MRRALRPLRRPTSLRLARFRRDEEGSMVIFGLFLFVMMLIVAGMAVDIMRFESTRARLQSTLDRAVLAAADLDQLRDAETVVRDYFDSADLLENLTSVTVTETMNSRRVDAAAAFEMPTFFMDMLGVETLEAPADGAAAEAINDIEVVLVLDVSGSMVQNGSDKLDNLQDAASEFVQTVLQNDTENRISIAIVPFNGQVNLGATLRAKFNVTDVTGVANVNCVDLPASVYSTLTMSRTLPMPATAWADTFSGTQRSNAYYNYSSSWSGSTYGQPIPSNRWCPAEGGNIVRLPTNSISQLQSNINGLVGIGATSINAGMRWGLTLLDPAQRPMFNELISASAIPSIFSGRPYDWDRDNTLKVIVLMTDGENFPEERVNDGYRSGNSPIYRATDGNGYYSIFHASKVTTTNATTICNSRPFWVPHLSQWHVRPWNGSSTGVTSGCYSSTATYTNTVRQTWPQVWSALRLRWVSWQLYTRPLAPSTSRNSYDDAQMNVFRTLTGSVGATPAMDAQLSQACDLAQANGVVVYGIAFEAPARGEQVIFDCASSPSHYYDAEGIQITSAFRAIAAQINALRLLN